MRTALQNYNVAAHALVPPRPPLSWDDVVEYAFLADFDLLSDTRSDVRLKVWAKPASRLLMDQHFKMLRAQEEIVRLNVEIPRLTTFIRDEETFLLQQEGKLQEADSPLSHQVRLRRLQFIRSNDLHVSRLCKLSRMQGFSGNITPGTSVESRTQPPTDVQIHHDLSTRESVQEHTVEEQEAQDEDEEELAGAEVVDAFCVVTEGPDF